MWPAHTLLYWVVETPVQSPKPSPKLRSVIVLGHVNYKIAGSSNKSAEATVAAQFASLARVDRVPIQFPRLAAIRREGLFEVRFLP